MARSVLLRFGTRNLDKARQAAKEIAKAMRDAAKGVKDVGKRRELLRQAKEQSREDRRVINEERKRQRGDLRSQRARRQSRQGFGAHGVPRFGDAGESLVAFADGKGGQRALDLTARSLAAVPILGEAIQLLWEEFGRPFIEAKLEALERERVQPLLVRLEEIERANLETRLEEDPGFGRRERAEQNRRDRVLESKRWDSAQAGALGRL